MKTLEAYEILEITSFMNNDRDPKPPFVNIVY